MIFTVVYPFSALTFVPATSKMIPDVCSGILNFANSLTHLIVVLDVNVMAVVVLVMVVVTVAIHSQAQLALMHPNHHASDNVPIGKELFYILERSALSLRNMSDNKHDREKTRDAKQPERSIKTSRILQRRKELGDKERQTPVD